MSLLTVSSSDLGLDQFIVKRYDGKVRSGVLFVKMFKSWRSTARSLLLVCLIYCLEIQLNVLWHNVDFLSTQWILHFPTYPLSLVYLCDHFTAEGFIQQNNCCQKSLKDLTHTHTQITLLFFLILFNSEGCLAMQIISFLQSEVLRCRLLKLLLPHCNGGFYALLCWKVLLTKLNRNINVSPG